MQTETAQIVNAGHPPPLRLRDGRATSVELTPDLPFGLSEHEYGLQPLALAPGGRLVFLTDGLLERNASNLDIDPRRRTPIEVGGPTHVAALDGRCPIPAESAVSIPCCCYVCDTDRCALPLLGVGAGRMKLNTRSGEDESVVWH